MSTTNIAAQVDVWLDCFSDTAGLDPATRAKWLGLAISRLGASGASNFGADYAEALALVTAHLYVCYSGTGSVSLGGMAVAGPITSLKTASQSIGFAKPTPSSASGSTAAAYERTQYGLDFLALCDRKAGTGPQIVSVWP